MIHAWTMDLASTLWMATTVPVLQNLLEIIVKVKIIIIIIFWLVNLARMRDAFRCRKRLLVCKSCFFLSEYMYFKNIYKYLKIVGLPGFLLMIFKNYSTSSRWIWYCTETTRCVAPSWLWSSHINMREGNNRFIKNAHKISRMFLHFIC